MQAKLLFLHALSPLHAGTGQGVGVIDLPIAREKATGIPFVPGSTIKGVLRDACPDNKKVVVFGPDTDSAELHAGSAQFTDQRLLLLPVRSLAGIFAWVTSPLLIRRFLRDVENIPSLKSTKVPFGPVSDDTCVVADGENCKLIVSHQGEDHVVLEDLSLTLEKQADLNHWACWLGSQLFPGDGYWQGALKERLCIVSDNVLSFLLQTGTEITARISLDDEKKTVKQGQLWYEEALPAESVLAGLVLATPVKVSGAEVDAVFKTIGDLAHKQTMQFGGNATVGRGLCQMRLS
ncbi:MAG: type III-B CRISPR module RAMP protein Cmr4 [Caldilineaceae bacterium]